MSTQKRSKGGHYSLNPSTVEKQETEAHPMPEDYSNFHPQRSIAETAAYFTELVNNKHKKPLPLPTDQRDRDEASKLACPASPAVSGPLTHHRFSRRDTVCAFCHETSAWILAAPQPQESTL